MFASLLRLAKESTQIAPAGAPTMVRRREGAASHNDRRGQDKERNRAVHRGRGGAGPAPPGRSLAAMSGSGVRNDKCYHTVYLVSSFFQGTSRDVFGFQKLAKYGRESNPKGGS